MKRNIAIVFVCASVGAMLSVLAADVVVGPPTEGNANDLLASALASAVSGDRVVLRAGEYRLDSPVVFPRGGGRGQPIALCGAPGEYVALLGSVRLTGWQKHEGRVWKVAHPPKLVKGLYEDSERLTHPRPYWGKREDPPVSELKAPGTWTQDDEWIYLWSREGDAPDNHRIEASQNHVMNVNKPWIRVEGIHMLFGQHLVCQITADHCEVIDCEIAHCSNSVDNSYNAYFSGCSNSAFRNCLMHDSFYWGDHGSNSHTMSTINCGDDGPNVVDGCEIFNGGLGIGTKGGVRELVVRDCYIHDEVNGISVSGERVRGPGAGKSDRGHYLIWRNRISHCAKGVWISSGGTHGNRVWGNLIEHCDAGVSMRDVSGVPDRSHLANNIFSGNGVAVYMVAGRDGAEKISVFRESGLLSHNNLFSRNGVDWQSPLTWGRSLDLALPEVQVFKDFGFEQDSIAAEPRLDELGRSQAGCPALGEGAELELPGSARKPDVWHIGLGPWTEREHRPDRGLALSITGSAESVTPGETVKLCAVIKNESAETKADLGGGRDAILTFHFRYRAGHRDKQELFRCRVELPDRELMPGETLNLASLPGWSTPVNGDLGEPFHLRIDTDQWRKGCRLRATARLVGRSEDTRKALQRLTDLVRSKEVIPVELKNRSGK